jgi:hypothetical protein
MCHSKVFQKMTAAEMFTAALMWHYDFLYANDYDGYEYFMLEMFGSGHRRSQLNPVVAVKKFCNWLTKDCGELLFEDFVIKTNYLQGEVLFCLYAEDGRQLRISWDRYHGPINFIWE